MSADGQIFVNKKGAGETGRPLFEIRSLCKSFGETAVLKNISTTISQGEVVVIVGPSGSGKSTFLRSLNLLEEPTSGQILFEGNDITDPATNINKYRQHIGMVFQHFNLFPHKTILQNLTLAPMKLLKKSRQEAEKEAMQLLQVCFGNPFPDTSRGQELINKIEGVNALPEGSPGRLEAEKQFKQIEEDRKTKIAILNTLAGIHDHPWVLELLDRYSKDPDAEISRRAKSITKKVKENRENDEANKSRRKAQYGA